MNVNIILGLFLLLFMLITAGIVSADEVNETATLNQDIDIKLSEDTKVIYVNQNSSSDGDGSLDNPYKSLDSACNNLSGENRVEINLYNGTYALDCDLKFNTNNLYINGIGSNVVLKNLNNTTQSSLGLNSTSSNFTISNIIFDSDNVNRALFYVFKGTCNLGVFNNCTFTNFNNTLMFTANFNKQFNYCNFINSRSSMFTATRLYKDMLNEFNYCIVSSSYSKFADKYYLGTNISFNNVWFGQNTLPLYIYPSALDVYQSVDYQAYVQGYTLPITRYAIFSAYENYLGNKTYEIIGKLMWNDSTTDGLDKLNPMTVKLSSQTGVFQEDTVVLQNGGFKTIFKSNSTNNKVKITLDSETISLNFYENMEVTAQDVYYGENQNITLNLPQGSKGFVNISVLNKTYSVNVSESLFNFTIPDQLSAGIHNISVLFSDSENHYYGSASLNFTIFKNNFELLILTPAQSHLGDEGIAITVLLPGDANGTLSIFNGGKNFTQDVSGGRENIEISSILYGGENTVSVIYNGNEKYLNQSKSTVITVDKFDPFMNITVPFNSKINETVILNITLPADSKGNITIFSNQKNLCENIEGGEINIDISSILLSGTNNVKVTYSGDEKYSAQTKTLNIDVEKIYPLMIAEISKDSVSVGENFLINVSFANTNVSGNISIKIADKQYIFAVGEIINVSCDIAGLNAVNITYLGDDIYYAQVQVFNVSVYKINISSNQMSVSVVGSNILISLPADVTGNITVNVNSKQYSAQLVNAHTSLSISDLAAGSYSAIVTYNGNNIYNPISKKITITVANKIVASKLTAKKKTFKAKKKTKKYSVFLKTSEGKAIKKVKLTLKIKNRTYRATTNTKGKAIFKITKLTKKGKYTSTIKFSGNNLYKSCSKKVKITIKK